MAPAPKTDDKTPTADPVDDDKTPTVVPVDDDEGPLLDKLRATMKEAAKEAFTEWSAEQPKPPKPAPSSKTTPPAPVSAPKVKGWLAKALAPDTE